MINQTKDINSLHEKIERYFNCELSDEEEKQLILQLSMTKTGDPIIDEAKALLGFRTIKEGIPKSDTSYRAFKIQKRKIISVAASIAILLSIGVAIDSISRHNESDKCVAYANGKKITDEEVIFSLMAQNMDELQDGVEDANDDILDEIDDLFPVAEKYDINFDPSDI